VTDEPTGMAGGWINYGLLYTKGFCTSKKAWPSKAMLFLFVVLL
jgi:hypothetical protein